MAEITQKNASKFHKFIKYILMGLIVIFSIEYIPNIKLNRHEIIMIGAISSITYGLIDIISPTVQIKKS